MSTTDANTTTATQHTDVLVLGWGKGGKTIAKQLGAAGRTVTLVEQDDHNVGGTCINIACVPTKALVHRADRHAAGDGVSDAEALSSAWSFRTTLTDRLREANRGMLASLDAVTLVHGRARFTGERTVEVRPVAGDGETLTITADHVVVNTGATPVRPDIPGVDLPGVFDSTSLQLELDAGRPPRRAAVVGGGPVGVEFASILAGLGVETTLLLRADALLPDEEPAVEESVRAALEDRGVRVRTGSAVTGVAQDEDALRVQADGGDVVVDAVLLATGRRPATDGLDLAAAGVETDERGAVRVDDRLRTSAEGVWAVGDVHGGRQQTFLSLDDGRIVLSQLTGHGGRAVSDRVAVPATVFVTPPLATVGMTAAQARSAGHRVRTATKKVAEIAAMPRPKTLEETHGVISFVVDADTDLILGARLHTVDAQDVINLVALAMRASVTAAQLRDGIWIHPSTTEAVNEVLAELE